MRILTDPKVAKESPSGGMDLSLSARERLDLNISTTFIELAITTLNSWTQDSGESLLQKARGTYAPYRIRNQTGSPIFVWSDIDSTANTKDVDAVKILNEQSIDWRFDDWKTMREVYPSQYSQLNSTDCFFSTFPQVSTTLGSNFRKNLGNN